MFRTCRQFIRTVPVLPHDEIDVDSAAEDHGGWDSSWGRKEEDRFRSRSGRRFPCGTRAFGIMTDYLRARFGERRSKASRKGDGRVGVRAARDQRTDASEGIYWTPAGKDLGSRHNGWELLRERLKNVVKPNGPRLFVFNYCRQFIRSVPVLTRDGIDMDDVNGAAEDHVGLGSALGTKEKDRFRSRSLLRFPCGTEGVRIMTDYLRAGFSEGRRGEGRAEAEKDALE